MAAVSITLSPSLSEQASAAATRERRPVQQIVEAALSSYLQQQRREALEAALRKGHEYGRSIGIHSEEDVRRIAEGEITLEEFKRSRSV